MKSKINIKLLFLILALLFLVLAIISIRTTYARYVTSLTAGGSVELGRWLIKVNDQNILDNADLSNIITPIFNEGSEYITEGKVAPASTGYTEIVIDYSKVTVPFKYDISFSSDTISDFSLTSYSVDGGAEIPIADPSSPITDTILPTDATRTRTLKLNFAWYEGAGEQLDDTSDTTYALEYDEIGMLFDLQFTQLQPTS